MPHDADTLERMRFSVEHSRDAVLWVDGSGALLYVNAAACTTLGYSREELLRLHVWDVAQLTPEEWPARWRDARSNRQMTVDGVHRRKDGTCFPIGVAISHFEFGSDEFVHVVARDVAERAATEEKLRASEERYRLLFERSLAAVLRTNVEGQVLDCNEACLKLFGISSKRQAVTLPVTAFYPDPAARDLLLERLRREGQVVNYEARFKRPGTGELFWCLANISLLDGDVIQGTLVDITNLKRLEEELLQSQKMEAVGRLAGGVAHDFNNILGVITGYADLLARELRSDERQAKRAAQIQKAAERAASLTRQLLAFSRKQVLEAKVLDLGAVVSDMEKMLRRLIGEDLQLEIACDPDLGLVKTDPSQLEQVVMNLVVNARDAMPRGGQLSIASHELDLDEAEARPLELAPGRYVALRVRDTGCGMDAETQKRIFEPFFTTKPTGTGTGLGLSTVYGIVKQSGGAVRVQSAPGRGATFEVLLPRVDERAEPVRAVAPPSTGHGETILLVEDEPALRELASELLLSCRYRVLAAATGRDALDVARVCGGRIDLVITDVVMPGMSGCDLARRLREAHGALRVLYISGYLDDAVTRNGIDDPKAEVLFKPFSMTQLARRVREALESTTNGKAECA